MKLTISSVLVSLLLVFSVSAIPTDHPAVQYAGTKVLRVPTGPSPAALRSLKSFIDALGLELWTTVPVVNSHVDVEVPLHKLDAFMAGVDGLLVAAEIRVPVQVMHDDLGASILSESEVSDDFKLSKAGSLVTPSWFSSYHPYADHLTFYSDLVSAFPDNAKIVTIGNTVEGRNITGINIFGSSGSGTKPAIIWHGNVHAREWITSMVNEYMAYQLLTNYNNSTDIKGFVDDYDFYIFPIVNPDGFVYTQTKDRMWRKNRQSPPSGSSCYGRDINRNWDIAWSDTGGASTNPCAEDYKGKAALDAPETKALAAFGNAMANSEAGAKMYVDWHSYSQMFFTPYGYDCKAVAPDNTELTALAAGFVSELEKVYGTQFTYGPSCTTIYKTTGSSDDYNYVVSKIKYSFAAELRDTGNNGFVLPANQIRPSGEEVWAGMKYLLANMK